MLRGCMGIGVCGEGWRGVGCWEGHMGYWRVEVMCGV